MSDQAPSEQRGDREHDALRLMIDSVKDYAIFMLDPAGTIATWNTGAERIKGYSADEIIGRHFSCFYPQEDIAAGAPEKELIDAAREGRVEFEGWRLRKDGTRFWANVVVTAVRDSAGELQGFAKVTRDLTERRRAEEELRRSEEQLRLLVESVEDYAIFMLDPRGIVTTWNPGAEKIKGYSAQEIIGRSFECFYPQEARQRGEPAQMLRRAEREGHIRVEGQRVRKDGSLFSAEALITPIRDAGGELRGFSKVTRDITEQLAKRRELEEAKQAAESASRAKDHFLAVLSHELRTPLTPVLAAVSYLDENASKLPVDLREELATIRRNVQTEARLIDDLLDVTRISRGKIELHFEAVDAHAALRQALDVCQPDVNAKGLEVLMSLRAREPYVWADPVRLQQIFWNLISNAVKFTPEHGRISLRTRNDDRGELVIEISDTGAGIEQEALGRIFNVFEQGERTVTRQFGGLGLGLTISKALVDLHRGVLVAQSEGPQTGATFRLSLGVIADYTAADEQASKVTAPRPHDIHVLLVEDHADTLRVLSRLLQRHGYIVTTASSVRSAVELLGRERVDILVSDIGLPDGNGWEIMKQARQTRSMKGIALTGFGMEEDVRKSADAGFQHHLTKPVDFDRLLLVLHRLAA